MPVRSLIPLQAKTKTVYKVRGITLNHNASQLVNFDAIKGMTLKGDETDVVTVHTERKMKCKRADGKISVISGLGDKM